MLMTGQGRDYCIWGSTWHLGAPCCQSATRRLDAKTLEFGLHCPLVARLVFRSALAPGYSREGPVVLFLGQAPESPSKTVRNESTVPVNFLSTSEAV